MTRRAFHALPAWTAPVVRAAYCAWQGRGDRRYVARTGQRFLPPARLRFHVGSVRPADYVRIGRRCAEDLDRALIDSGRTWAGIERVLDFGCGCGRTLIWLRDREPRFTGTDLHEDCIRWAERNLTFADFQRNRPTPPLDLPAATFDLAFSCSVFTHLDEADQRAWLSEMRRLSRPGALLLFSVHGESCRTDLSPEQLGEVERRGFLAVPARGLWGVFERYFNSYHSEPYVRRVWGEFFTVLDYRPRGLNDHQDLVVLARDGSP